VSVFVLADIPTAPPPARRWDGLVHELVGADGSTWVLTDWRSGVFLGTDGVLGLMEAPAERYTSTSPAVAGSTWRGSWVKERPVRWRVHVSHRDRSRWLSLHRAFFGALSTTALATWRVGFPDGSWRSLDVRLTGTGPHAFAHDPVRRGWAVIDVDLVAEDPWWRGNPVVQSWSDDTEDKLFFGGAAMAGPTFFLSSSSLIDSAQMSNPGDVDAWPVWTVRASGKTSAVSLGVGGAQITAAVDMDTGDVLVIDTDPRRQSCTLNGTRTRGLLVEHEFAPIPPGAHVDLDISLSGYGSVQAAIVPRWARCL